jgi:serine/threonine-protein kinase ATR
MRVLRNNEDTLMTVLETFIHDPAVDMVKKVRVSSISPPQDIVYLIKRTSLSL